MVAGALHLYMLNLLSYTLPTDQVVASYVFNFFIAVVIFAGLVFLKKNNEQILGFIFMGGSGVKFACFFIFFYPLYKNDGDMSRVEFFVFFIPYAIALLLEVIFLAKLLKK